MDAVTPPPEWYALNLYAELGVARTASHEQVRAAYRDLAQRFHPDLHPDDLLAEERFKRISAAYKVLAHPPSRAAYDRLHLAGPRPIAMRPAPAHRVPTVRPARSTASRPPTEPRHPPAVPARPRDEATTLSSVAVWVLLGALVIVAAIAVSIFVIGPDCDVPRELQRLGCPPAP